MSIPVRIEARCLTGGVSGVLVRSNGSLVVGPLDDLSASATADTDGVTAALISPLAQHDIVITGAIFSTNRDVGMNGATLDFFYATTNDSTDTANQLVNIVDMVKNLVVAVAPLHLRVPPGNFVLFKTNDNKATASAFFHYEAV